MTRLRPTRPDVLHATRATSAGVRRHVVDLILGLDALGVTQALAYAPGDADQAFWDGLRRIEARGIAAFPVEMTRELSPSADFVAGCALRAHARQLRPRVLHLHSSKAGGIGRLAALTLPGLPVVYSPHASAAHLGRLYANIERILGRLRTDRVIAVSNSEREEIARLGYVTPKRLVSVDCGIDADEVRTAATEPPPVVLSDGPLVVSAGRLSEQKNPLLLVHAGPAIVRAVPDARFVWIGDGELRGAVDRAIDESGLRDRWTITGWVANPHPVLARAAVFVLPSRYESFGYVTLEAMVLGRPVVATAVAGSCDLVVEGETGSLVPEGDSAALGNAIAALLGDQALAARMGEAGRARAARFSRDRMARGVREIYRAVAGTGLGVSSTSRNTPASVAADAVHE